MRASEQCWMRCFLCVNFFVGLSFITACSFGGSTRTCSSCGGGEWCDNSGMYTIIMRAHVAEEAETWWFPEFVYARMQVNVGGWLREIQSLWKSPRLKLFLKNNKSLYPDCVVYKLLVFSHICLSQSDAVDHYVTSWVIKLTANRCRNCEPVIRRAWQTVWVRVCKRTNIVYSL